MDTADGSMVLLSVVKDDIAGWCWFYGGHHKKGIYSEVLHSMKCQQTRNCGGYKKIMVDIKKSGVISVGISSQLVLFPSFIFRRCSKDFLRSFETTTSRIYKSKVEAFGPIWSSYLDS